MTDHVQRLEDRRLLSVAIAESEPNNAATTANPVRRVLDDHMVVSGRVDAVGDHDWFKVQLKKGDVVGATVTGAGDLDTTVRLVDAAGKLLVGNDDNIFFGGTGYLPAESPLPFTTSSRTGRRRVLRHPGGRQIFSGRRRARRRAGGSVPPRPRRRAPWPESAPLGTRQTVFLDFDGSTLDMADYFLPEFGTATFLPLADSLPRWGMSADASVGAARHGRTETPSPCIRCTGHPRTGGHPRLTHA